MNRKAKRRDFYYGIEFMNNCFQAFDTPGTTYREMKSELIRLKKERPIMYLNPSSKIVRVRKI